MPTDALSVFVLILLHAATTAERLAPYVLAGIVAAVLLSWIVQRRDEIVPRCIPRPLMTPLACLMGVLSPVPTTSIVPIVMRLRAGRLSASAALGFVLASSLMNPQLFLLTWGALGWRFALLQLGSVLALSASAGWALAGQNSGFRPIRDPGERLSGGHRPSSWRRWINLTEHIVWHVLVGVLVGASLQVLLPRLRILDWMGDRGWLSSPLLGWVGAPFYVCGGTAVPLALTLMWAGFSPGTLFAFLLVGPALRGTTLGNLGSLLSRRQLIACLLMLGLSSGLLGFALDQLIRISP